MPALLIRSMIVGGIFVASRFTMIAPVEAARVPTCLRVVPSGALVIRYGVSSCRRSG
ncbi:MAG: hypothetical protein MUF72_09735 [Elainella sp. Prado103]|nr:hypothetical protein [Elainella sp. Prado103]